MKRALLFLAVLLIAATVLWTDSVSDWEASANRGDAEAQYNMGQVYRLGRDGVKIDYRTAAGWYIKALNNSSANGEVKRLARENLGTCYTRIAPGAEDDQEEFLWYLKSAELGHGLGYLSLGLDYETGKIVKEDKNTAIYWYEKVQSSHGVNEFAYSDAEARLKRLREQGYSSDRAAPPPKITITGVSFANTDKEGSIIDSYGAELKTKRMRYLAPRISYTSTIPADDERSLWIRIKKPDGNTIFYDANASFTANRSSGTVELTGWGNNNTSIYPAGDYTFEIYQYGDRVYSAGFKVTRELATYLTVNGWTGVNQTFGYGGGSATMPVATDGESWTIASRPSWCTASASSGSISLYCSVNPNYSSRSGDIIVRADNKEVKITVTQDAAPVTCICLNGALNCNECNGMQCYFYNPFGGYWAPCAGGNQCVHCGPYQR